MDHRGHAPTHIHWLEGANEFPGMLITLDVSARLARELVRADLSPSGRQLARIQQSGAQQPGRLN